MSTSVFHFEATDVSQLLRDKQLNRGIEPRCVVSFISYALEQPRPGQESLKSKFSLMLTYSLFSFSLSLSFVFFFLKLQEKNSPAASA